MARSAPPPPRDVRLDVPPPAASAARLASGFGRRFMLLVDTEEEFDWRAPFSHDATATTAIASLPPLDRRLRDGGARPIYMIDHPVAASPEAVDVLKRITEGEPGAIGAQLHAWVTPPFDEALTARNSFAGNLPRALEAAKLAALTERIAASFGTRPIAFRAGRYGVGPATAALLLDEGYRLDSSVRPHFAYRAEGGPDFLRHPRAPYWAGPDASLLELPLGAGFTGVARHVGPLLHAAGEHVPRLRGALARGGLLARIGFTPEGFPVEAALAAIGHALDGGARVLALSFHSTSAAPGHTPYVRDAADLARLGGWFDRVLSFLAREGVTAASADDLLDAAWSARG